MMNIKKDKLYNAFINGAFEVMDNRVLLNEINVFPVPDSDTGSNLYNMMNHIVLNSELKPSLKDTLESIADSAIVGARGNSGLIFAQYFHGISKVSNDYNEITARDFVSAAYLGFDHAYKAVEEPVEGTILTTMRVFYESLNSGLEEAASFLELLEKAYLSVESAVLKTTDQLLNLRRASVVDSGAKGFSCFIKGFIDALKGESKSIYDLSDTNDEEELEFHEAQEVHNFSSEIRYRYCTEALIEGSDFEIDEMKKLISVLGDSIVVSKGSRKSRVHIHTNKPWEVFEILSSNQIIISQKVDDMRWQYDVIHNRKYKKVVVTDSVADIPKAILDDEQVVVIHLDILLDVESHIDKLTLTNDYIFNWIEKNHKQPTSSQPSLSNLEKMLSNLLNYYEEVIVITVSKELSGTYNVITKAAEMFGNRVAVINSKQNSVAEGLVVLGALEGVQNNLEREVICSDVYNVVKKTKILVSISNLDRMIASGRLTSRVGKIASMLRLKPIITLDENGMGAVEKIAFGRANSYKKILKHLIEIDKRDKILKYALTYVDDKEQAKYFANQIESALGFPCVYVVESSSIIAMGAGKGAIAVAYTTR